MPTEKEAQEIETKFGWLIWCVERYLGSEKLSLLITKYLGNPFTHSKIFVESQACWFVPVVPITRDAEAGGSLELKSSRPAWEI